MINRNSQANRAPMARLFASLSVALGLLAALATGATAQADYYDITVTDLTSGQPFSPPVFATHDASARLWQEGQSASLGLQMIAETGDRTQAITDLTPLVGGAILDLRTPLSSPLPPGNSFTVTVAADSSHPLLSAMWMLGRTNDGFSGLDSINLVSAVGATIDVVGYDAGTEVNNELASHLVALGGQLREPENGVIHLHPGILGTADAPASWNWTNPVARIQVARSPIPEPGSLALLATGLLPFLAKRRRRLG